MEGRIIFLGGTVRYINMAIECMAGHVCFEFKEKKNYLKGDGSQFN